jgi:hypothetical protein
MHIHLNEPASTASEGLVLLQNEEILLSINGNGDLFVKGMITSDVNNTARQDQNFLPIT